MKELLLIGTTIVTLATGSISAATSIETPNRPIRGNHVSVALLDKAELVAEAKADMLKQMARQAKIDEINAAIKKLRSHVGKTWYVFSGATPSGWDCSGLTMWFYQQLDIELEHRASKQDDAGTKTSQPMPGDLVVFHYKGSSDAYHVGIYVGNGEMIHAPKHGHVTRVENIKSFGGNYSTIEYRRIVNID